MRVGIWASCLCIFLGFAGCGEPEEVDPVERARERSAMLERAREQRQASELAIRRREAEGAAGQRLGARPALRARVKFELLDRYGPELTPFQRSALLAAQIETYEEGEALCRKWIEENRRFERGSSP